MMKRRRAIRTGVALVAAGAAVGVMLGCAEILDQVLGSDKGLLLYGFDVAATPGMEVNLQARLQEGGFLVDQSDRTIRFFVGDELKSSAKTDGEGIATVQFTPEAVGDYVFTVVVERPKEEDDEDDKYPSPVPMLVACRKADVPVAVVDLDKTLVASGFWDVFSKGAEDPEPMPYSKDVMARIAKDYFVVYLTHRPDYFGPKSKGWLKGHSYPEGPVLLSRAGGFLKGSGEFKTAALQKLGKTFANIKVGVGDKLSDVEAYHANNMKAILVLPPGEDPKADDLEELATDLETLPEEIHVVESWKGVEEVLYKGADYKRAKRVDQLRKQAAELKAKEN